MPRPPKQELVARLKGRIGLESLPGLMAAITGIGAEPERVIDRVVQALNICHALSSIEKGKSVRPGVRRGAPRHDELRFVMVELRRTFRSVYRGKPWGSKAREAKFVTDCLLAARLIPSATNNPLSPASETWARKLRDPLNSPSIFNDRVRQIEEIAKRSERKRRPQRDSEEPEGV